MATFQIERHLDAPRAGAWEVLSDLDGWGAHAPNLSKTEVVEGAAEGAVRRCHNNAGKGWTETCTLWQPGRRYVMEVDTSDYPFPLEVVRGTFSVVDDGPGSRVTLRFDYKFRYGIFGRILGATRPGARASDLYAVAADGYRDAGFPGEELKHHQGGAIGYRAREWVAHPRSEEVVRERQAFAWNPTITGTKIEDTALVIGDSVEIITSTPDWPAITLGAPDRRFHAADVWRLA